MQLVLSQTRQPLLVPIETPNVELVISGSDMTPDRIQALQKQYDLSYHIPYALEGEKVVGLRGRRVLEVGGSLPEEFVLDDLGAEQWVATHEMAYWNEITVDGGGTHPSQAPSRRLKEIGTRSELGPYEVLSGGIEELPESLHDAFDVIFSIATFEHILTLPKALLKMHAALRPGGKLFTMFSPIWSAHDGHHLPKIVDGRGTEFSFGKSPIPAWGHLLLRPPQMMNHLVEHTDFETAAKITYYVYHSPHINRLFTEDYALYVSASPFKIDTLVGTFEVKAPEDLIQTLAKLHPGRRYFTNNGLLMALHRAE